MDPRRPVTGSVTAWMPPETPDVRPESNDGWLTVAASACSAERDRSKQIPPPAIANRAARRMTRRVFGFDIDNSQSPGTHPCHLDARPVGYKEDPGSVNQRSRTSVLYGHHRTDVRAWMPPVA